MVYPVSDISSDLMFYVIVNHGVFFLFQIFELIVNKIQFTKCNLYLTIFVGCLYFIFNWIIYLITDDEIYAGLTFDNLMTIIYFVMGNLLNMLGFCIGFSVTKRCKKIELKSNEKGEISN